MALTILRVTLTPGKLLDVSDGELRVAKSNNIEVIVWQLAGGGLKDAWFLDVDTGPTRGFTWINPPDDRIFSLPRRSANNQRLIMDDDHPGGYSLGKWIYMLNVAVPNAGGGYDIRSTTHSLQKKDVREGLSLIRTTNNPIIINH